MNPNHDINHALEILRNDGVVGMPTETVYGLAGSINSEKALRKIFEVKERPFFDPLIVHISNINELESITTLKDSATLERLTAKFWPGPLTIVLPKSNIVNPLITSGFDTVAVRMPKHVIALELIKKLGSPVAAPSANKFSKTSPTTAQHVMNSFKNENIFVLDGGPCDVGIESTVIMLDYLNTPNKVAILRPGIISKFDIIEALDNEIEVVYEESPVSPGSLKHHYMPTNPLVLFSSNYSNYDIEKYLNDFSIKHSFYANNPTELILDNDPNIAARELYSKLRLIDEQTNRILFCKLPKNTDDKWLGILDRLEKAATYYLK